MIFNAYSNSAEGLLGFSLRSAGHIFAKQGRRISRPAGRADWLLFYVAKGSERFTLSDVRDMQEGAFILFRPGEAQEHVHSDAQTGEFYYIHFDAPADFDLFGLRSSEIYQTLPSAAVRDLFERVIAELQGKRQGFERLCAISLLEILALLAREVAAHALPDTRHAGQIAFVIEQINRDFAKNRPLEHYAALCHMSKFHFLRVFKEITGTSPAEYRNGIRMEHARLLLEDHALPVQEIAAQLGYASPAYFCAAFKKNHGLSPTEYRSTRQKALLGC